jgi:hypothetical protein
VLLLLVGNVLVKRLKIRNRQRLLVNRFANGNFFERENMSEDRKMIEAQNKRIALLEDAMESLHMEIAFIHEVTSIIKATGCMPAVANGAYTYNLSSAKIST